jgi:hypothetical protein
MSGIEIPDEAVVLGAVAITEADRESDWAAAPATESARVALAAAVPLIVAAELDRLAEPYRKEARQERLRSDRLRNGAPKWQYESSIASYQELSAVARRLSKRAAELRAHPPEPKEPK